MLILKGLGEAREKGPPNKKAAAELPQSGNLPVHILPERVVTSQEKIERPKKLALKVGKGVAQRGRNELRPYKGGRSVFCG